jgi:hypothetical protein
MWSKAQKWTEISNLYEDRTRGIGNETVEVDFHTELTPEDFPKRSVSKDDSVSIEIAIAEVLSYFLKDEK